MRYLGQAPSRHQASSKKSSAQLDREIAQVLAREPVSGFGAVHHATIRSNAEIRKLFLDLVQEEPPQFEVAEDLLRQEDVSLRAMMNGEQVLHFVLYTKTLPGDADWQTKERKVGGGFTPASKDGRDDRTRASWIDFYVQHGPSRYSFSKKLDKPMDADQTRKMVAATIWEITKRLAPFSSDTDEATIKRMADKAVKQRHNIAKRYADIA